MSDSFLDVELFLRANDRLPTRDGDVLTKEMVKKVLDKALLEGDEKCKAVMSYAFHKYGVLSCDGDNCPDHKDH